ncbi:MAG: polymorphic toxin type 37 domain-containing protein [Acidimicrobiales bacterium]|jgi:hypothetical protein
MPFDSSNCSINRYYDPTTDQFLSIDPDVEQTNQPYVFTDDDPLNAEDPLGLEEFGYGVGPPTEGEGIAGSGFGGTSGGGGDSGTGVEGNSGDGNSSNGEAKGNVGKGSDKGENAPEGFNKAGEVGSVPSSMPNFSDPSDPPGPGWEWRGNGPPGSSQGSWYDPLNDESLHPDLEHGGNIGPHYDYKDSSGKVFRIFPDGSIIPK